MIFNHFSTFVTTLCTIFYKLKKIIAHPKTTSVKYCLFAWCRYVQ